MTRAVIVALLLTLGVGGLSGCYVVSPYTYAPPPPPPPPYAPPGAPAPAPARPGSAQNCQTVTVEGHYETVVRANGQRETVWVPAQQQNVCR